MGELIRRAGALVRPEGRDVMRPTGTADSTARVTFEGTVVTWRDLAAETRRAARRRSRVLAEDVQITEIGRIERGAIWQDAVAWRLHDDAVLVADVARPVQIDAGSVTRAGAWVHRSLAVLPATGPLRRRTGVIPVADELARRDAGQAAPVGRTRFGAAESVWEYLPSAVREGAERLVPEPTGWYATLAQTMDGNRLPTGQDLRVLRVSPERAVVILASRDAGSGDGGSHETRRRSLAISPWLVEQLGFELAPTPVQAVEARQAGRVER